MPLQLLRINYGALRHSAQEPSAEPTHWRLYAPCSEADPDTCHVLQSIVQMRALKDRKAAIAALVKLVQVAASGKPLQIFYDEKQCHAIHRFHHDGRERVVWRIRSGDIRVVFHYGNGRLVFLADALVKRRDTLSRAEKAALERQVTEFIEAEQANALALFDFVAPSAHPGATP